ncbi:hypothetical protein [Exiguobacterium sp. RIT341]|uniref:hypothetical protein n=1 Tax=Exiguobacterium sp. RIT341 TaxID=1470592 RepID=UPI00044B2018|nr:hypothetical protein [Exiguobacterium sp. RIT341]EZP61839.1 hypothetical protein BW42_01510 [Exiguobacterium sp. RIT341]
MEIIVIVLAISAAYAVQRMLGKVKVKFIGYIIPTLIVLSGISATTRNFKVAYSMGSYISAVLVIVVYALLTYWLYRVYDRAKEEAEYPYQSLKDRGIL